MSPPVRKGDGTGVVPQDIAEVRTGDGRVLFGGAILDSVAIHQYDATQLTGLNDGEAVGTWTDSVGSNDATASSSPIYKTSQINGNPVVRYDGEDDYHDTGYSPNTDNNLSVIIVTDYNTVTDSAPFGGLDSNLDSRFTIDESGGGYSAVYSDSNDVVDTIPSNTPVLLTLRAKNGTVFFRENGSQLTSFAYGSGGSSDATQFIGARNRQDGNSTDNYFDGDIGELVIYDGLKDSERDSEEQRLSDKWGITI